MSNSEIPGFFNFHEMYRKLIEEAPPTSTIVEVGTYLGASFSYLVKEGLASGKQLRCVAVDHWQDVNTDVFDPVAEGVSTFDKFTMYMSGAGLSGEYEALPCDSVRAAAYFKDKSLFAVFIDACHDYDAVKADIEAWKPKIMVDGYLCGHDILHKPVEKAVCDTLGTYNFLSHCWWVKL